MEQDFGYVKVRMGPLIPPNRNGPPYINYQTEFHRHPPQYRSSRHLKPKYLEHTTSNYDNYYEQRHPGGIGRMQPSGCANYNMGYHYQPRDYRYPEPHCVENMLHGRDNQLIRLNQVQRSNSFYSLSHQMPFNNGADTKPVFPHPDYGNRSRSVNTQHRVSQESQRSISVDPQPRLRHECRSSKGQEYQKETKLDGRNTSDNLKKPFIPKPDYTWHRKKKLIYD